MRGVRPGLISHLGKVSAYDARPPFAKTREHEGPFRGQAAANREGADSLGGLRVSAPEPPIARVCRNLAMRPWIAMWEKRLSDGILDDS